MAEPLLLSASRSCPLDVGAAFDAVLPLPLPQLFDRRYGLIPAIARVAGPEQPWGTVGQERTIHLAGGASMRERLTEVDRPHRFAYRLTEVTGPLKLIAASVDGAWSFEPAPGGTVITWRWTVHPAAAMLAPVRRVFARMWHGYAEQSLARLESLICPN